MKLIVSLLACTALLGASTSASAQFGSIVSKIPGLGAGGGSTSASGDIDAYVARSTETAILMMTAVAILDYARSPQKEMAALKAEIGTIQGKKDPKELNAYKTSIAPQAKALNDDANAAAAIQARYEKASSEEKALISSAVFNMAIAIPRAVKLAQDGPALINGLVSDPMALAKIGKIKASVELSAYQIGATVKFVTLLPKLMTAVKLQMPADAEAAKPRNVII